MESGRTGRTCGAAVLVFLMRCGAWEGVRWALPTPGRGMIPLHPTWICGGNKIYNSATSFLLFFVVANKVLWYHILKR